MVCCQAKTPAVILHLAGFLLRCCRAIYQIQFCGGALLLQLLQLLLGGNKECDGFLGLAVNSSYMTTQELQHPLDLW